MRLPPHYLPQAQTRGATPVTRRLGLLAKSKRRRAALLALLLDWASRYGAQR